MSEQKDYSDVIDLDGDDFIDAENNDWFKKGDSYETIIVRHIQKCIDILSMDKHSCYERVKVKGGYEIVIQKDLNELIIRNVDILRQLLVKELNRNENYRKQVERILRDSKEYDEKFGEREIVIYGKGKHKIKDIMLEDTHPLKIKHNEYHAKQFREMFEILIRCYNKAKEQAKEDEIDRWIPDEEIKDLTETEKEVK